MSDDEGAVPPHPAPPGMSLVRLFAVMVPAWRRTDWIAEWDGELSWAWRRARERRGDDGASWRASIDAARLILRALGAASDAFTLRRTYGASDVFGLDLRYAARSLRRRPGFSFIVILTLALGIGATTAIFSVVNGVLLRPLDFPEPERLVTVDGLATDGNAEKTGSSSSYPDYDDMRTRAHSFSELAAVRSWRAVLTGGGTEPRRIETALVTDNFFRTLGTRPIVGRGFVAAETKPGATEVAVLSNALWTARFGGDPSIIGRNVTIDGKPVTVVGVLPPNLSLARNVDVWRPFVPDKIDLARGAHRISIFGRLRAGVSLAQANAEVKSIARALEQQYPESNTTRSAKVQLLRDDVVAPVRPALLVLLGAVMLVLIVGCVNLASLFLARAASREREMAVREALGAGRGDLLRQWMAESLLLAMGGAFAGLAVAWAGMRALLALAPTTIPRADEVSLDPVVLLFLLGVSVFTGLLFGALPALQHRRAESTIDTLRDAARGATAGRRRQRLRQGLVISEVALATVLVTGAALLLQTFWHLTHVDLRFKPQGLLVAHVQLPETQYNSAERVLQLFERIESTVAAMPQVRDVSLSYENPMSEGWTSSYAIAGEKPPPRGLEPEARIRPVTPGYFRATGETLLRGRDVSRSDRFDTPGVAVVNEAFVKRHFATKNPIGQRIDRGQAWWPGQPTMFEIVGVVADEPFMGPAAQPSPALYFPHAQFPMADMWLVIRSDGDLGALAPALRRAVWSVDPDLPLDELFPMTDLVARATTSQRFNTMLLTLFAGAALLLAAIGIYGVLSYTVAQRTGEIGIRMALGANGGQLVRQIVGQGLGVALIGVALGVPAAFGASRLLATALEGVKTVDPIVVFVVTGTLLLVSTLAAWAPARRASRVSPMVALRAE